MHKNNSFNNSLLKTESQEPLNESSESLLSKSKWDFNNNGLMELYY